MTSDPLAIDVDFSEVSPPRETSPKVVEFRGTSGKDSGKPRETSPKDTATLAKAVGVSEPTIRKWMRGFGSVVPMNMLSAGRGQWTDLAQRMLQDFDHHRHAGMCLEHWLKTCGPVYAPSPQQHAEAVVFEAEKSGAIVPAEVVEYSDGLDGALALAQQQRATAEAVLDVVFDSLLSAQRQQRETTVQIDEAAIVADELAKIAKEEQLRAQIRAKYQQRKQAAAQEVSE